jgi:hypothetical protein
MLVVGTIMLLIVITVAPDSLPIYDPIAQDLNSAFPALSLTVGDNNFCTDERHPFNPLDLRSALSACCSPSFSAALWGHHQPFGHVTLASTGWLTSDGVPS